MFERYAPIAPPGSLAPGPLPKTFRVNTLKADEATALFGLEGIAIEQAPWGDAFIARAADRHALGNTRAHFLGHIYVQDLASQLPVLALREALGAGTVFDACAAPGSKTTQLAAALNNHGAIVANDSSFQRIKALKSNLERLGVLNTVITNHDLLAFPRVEFPCIVLDAPCSSEGTFRKSIQPEPVPLHRIHELASLQRRLLAKAFSLLAPGGTLLYSTCALAPEENELVVASLLEAQPAAALEPIELPDVPLAPALTEWEGRSLPTADARRLWPGECWGGFFLAKLRRR